MSHLPDHAPSRSAAHAPPFSARVSFRSRSLSPCTTWILLSDDFTLNSLQVAPSSPAPPPRIRPPITCVPRMPPSNPPHLRDHTLPPPSLSSTAPPTPLLSQTGRTLTLSHPSSSAAPAATRHSAARSRCTAIHRAAHPTAPPCRRTRCRSAPHRRPGQASCRRDSQAIPMHRRTRCTLYRRPPPLLSPPRALRRRSLTTALLCMHPHPCFPVVHLPPPLSPFCSPFSSLHLCSLLCLPNIFCLRLFIVPYFPTRLPPTLRYRTLYLRCLASLC
jgi:hypothetical protein